MKPTLSQISSLIDGLKNEMEYMDFENAFSKLQDMTEKQYKYALALWFNHKYEELRKLLQSFGINKK